MSRKALWINVALAGILTAGIGVVTNLVTEKFSWTLLAVLLTLVVSGVLVAGLQMISGEVANQRTSVGTSEVPLTSSSHTTSNSQFIQVFGNRNRFVQNVQRLVVGISVQTFSAILAIVVVGFASAIYVIIEREQQQAQQKQQYAGQPPAIPNPYSYVSFDRYAPARDQECPGLFGLCVNAGQSLDAAEQLFVAHDEIPGSRSGLTWGQLDSECRAWELRNTKGVIVCAADEQITWIQVWVIPETPLTLATFGGEVHLPGSLGVISEEINRLVDAPPYSIRQIDGEGNWRNRAAWHYVGSEGVILADITVAGDSFKHWNTGGRPICDYRNAFPHLATVDVSLLTVQIWDVNQELGCPAG
ncbi:hypothetical protein I0C86_30950 [Plantactinospora sp. S1510]|uniref:Uncharacterized protein n=1 Tax=Plantactinospora alkalitolerans TaxID=2789879 RepID=A0ABS0H5F6_9ACTN|nr:hypothetical protein [Plantactinospora alkalitolerans]MBF9133347.1 hypothetical protein [Plantactinospora alkalitolerans]